MSIFNGQTPYKSYRNDKLERHVRCVSGTNLLGMFEIFEIFILVLFILSIYIPSKFPSMIYEPAAWKEFCCYKVGH